MVNKFSPNTRRYHKTNFADLLEVLTPDVYIEQDVALSGEGLNPISDIINCHINIANEFSSVLQVSAIAGTQSANLSSISGVSQYFVKQNKLTNIGPFEFESKILNPLGVSLKDFSTSAEFYSYLSGNLLPKITPPVHNISNAIQSNIGVLSALTGNTNVSSVHNYLIDALGWFYFLNNRPVPRIDVYVTNFNDTSFLFDGGERPDLLAGNVYRFTMDSALPASATLRFTADGTSEYTTGIYRSGTVGTVGAYVDFYVTKDTPLDLWFYRGSTVDTSYGETFSFPEYDLIYSPSSYVLESLSKLYTGTKLETVDGIKGLVEFVWKNYSIRSFNSYMPSLYASGYYDAILTDTVGAVFDEQGNVVTDGEGTPLWDNPVAATYTSGTQKLDALLTLVDVIYSPLYIDQKDFSVRDAFDRFIESQTYLTDLKSKGPFRKFLNLLGFEFSDLNDEVENIGLIYDVENVQDEHLQYIAELIGFKLRGNSPAKWRHQILTAIQLYKSSGTVAAIQAAINSLIIDSVFDVSGSVQELWESYIPFLIWYSLATESPLFKSLNTWTPDVALQGGITVGYNTSSLEENLKTVTDSIILDIYKQFPNNFIFNGKRFDPPRFALVDRVTGKELETYTYIGEPNMKKFTMFEANTEAFKYLRQQAKANGELKAFDAATGFGALGSGVYVVGAANDTDTAEFERIINTYPSYKDRPQNTVIQYFSLPLIYLKPKGNLNAVYNYRGKTIYPLPPFEEAKYYRDCSVTPELVQYLVERLKCFKVRKAFADQVGDYILSKAVTNTTDLGSLNEWLMFSTSLETPPNFDEVMLNVSEYEKNLIPLWCGKSSHLFINFPDTDFDFSKTTLEGDGRYALYEAARVAREFAPAHAITRTTISGSAIDYYSTSSTKYDYVNSDHDDYRIGYTSAAVFGNFEYSGARMYFTTGGGDNSLGSDGGRGGLNTFKRSDVDLMTDVLLSSTESIVSNVARRDLRRRNLKYLLPHEGYYDRTGFTAPVTFDASVLEKSLASSLGEATLGYVASAGRFHPVIDPINPSGVWNICEGLNSSRSFFGVPTSSTFPYRGLYSLGSNAKAPEEGSRPSRYIDRGQVPQIYITMNKLLYEKAKAYAGYQISATPYLYTASNNWKDNITSLANQEIADGYVINSFSDYENFSFGKGIHKLHRDYCKYFNKHSLNPTQMDKTGGNIFAHVYGKGLYNCDFSVQGSAVGSFIAPTAYAVSSVNTSTVWKVGGNGTYIASSAGKTVVPLYGTFTQGNAFNAEFRNPHILSGVEFCDVSGAPSRNEFSIFKLDPSTAVKGMENPLINNTVIKCKSVGGLPRIRFDLSSYGDRRNYFIKDHKFNLELSCLVADETDPILGGGQVGIWIHTEPVSGVIWSWTPLNKWQVCRESDISIDLIKSSLAHIHTFGVQTVPATCFENFDRTAEDTNDLTLQSMKKDYFKKVSVEFDTRNYTISNNSEYLQIIPVQESEYVITEQVNRDNTNYIVEIFFVPNNNINKYLLIDSISLQDLTLREYAGIGTGFGIETSGTPLTPFVKEYLMYLDKEELRDVLKFYNSLAGLESGQYATNLASRNATTTSSILEASGGSRLNYKIHPEWVSYTKDGTYGYYTSLELDN